MYLEASPKPGNLPGSRTMFYPASSSETTERGDAMMTLAPTPLAPTQLVPTPLAPTIGLEDVPCRRFDPDLWFADAPAELELAKSMCSDCPVRVECLAGAIERAEPWGVWGGEIFERGTIVARKRPRGRPRKDERTVVAA
jgi:WhiB family transcriptional regulator, redox-sensing transcriptional regulator